MVPPPCFHLPRGPTGSDMGFLPLHGPWCDKHACAHTHTHTYTHKHSFAGKSQWWPTEGQLYAGFPNDFMPREPSWPDPPMRITSIYGLYFLTFIHYLVIMPKMLFLFEGLWAFSGKAPWELFFLKTASRVVMDWLWFHVLYLWMCPSIQVLQLVFHDHHFIKPS